jgi:hypothetical protein
LNSDSSEILYKRDIKKEEVKQEEIPQWEKFNRNFGVQDKIPELKPYFKDIKIDTDGRIWVWRYAEAEEIDFSNYSNQKYENGWWEQPAFDVFKESGEFYGTVTLPFNAEFMDAKGENVWAVYTNEKGVETVVQYKLSDF